MTASVFNQTFNSFSGVDMNVTLGQEHVAQVQGLSYTITREKAPLYTMGSADPRSFSRGKRGIAGSLIFLTFDRSALLDSLKIQKDLRPALNTYELTTEQQRAVAETVLSSTFGATAAAAPSTLALNSAITGLMAAGAAKQHAPAQYPDQVLPFDITITAANEYGAIMSMQILNVEIMNCGSGMSIDDITVDESCTFVCTQVIPWGNQKFISSDGVVKDVSQQHRVPQSGGGR